MLQIKKKQCYKQRRNNVTNKEETMLQIKKQCYK